jgi:hypothetical protein
MVNSALCDFRYQTFAVLPNGASLSNFGKSTMKLRTASYWISIVGNVALLVGLAAVVYELNQNQTHTLVQMLNDDYINVQNRFYTLMGENPAATIAKAKLGDELSEEDRVILDAYLFSKFIQFETYEYISAYGVYPEAGATDEEAIARVFRKEWDFPYAEQWWRQERNRIVGPGNRRLASTIDKLYGI